MPLISRRGAAAAQAFGFTSGESSINTTFLLVGGGGGSGGAYSAWNSGSGGGGGGQVLPGVFTLTPATSYAITIGAGGTAGPSPGKGGDGGISTAFGQTALGGGGGGAAATGNVVVIGNSGLTGGGGGGYEAGYTGVGGTGTPPLGYGGGRAINNGSGAVRGGGGGGVATPGTDATTSAAGAGGNGVASSITGTPTYYGGGGGGGAGGAGPAGAGGLGGGGAGALNNAGAQGQANTGGGGGGSGMYTSGSAITGAAGGGGVLHVSYPLPFRATGGLLNIIGANALHTFTTAFPGPLVTTPGGGPVPTYAMEYLVVGGGGSGGSGQYQVGGQGGGGGGGGVRTGTLDFPAGGFTVTVGKGAADTIGYGSQGQDGLPSNVYTLTALGGGGGGGGGGHGTYPVPTPGRSGASGGGGGWMNNSTFGAGGAGTPGQGFDGVSAAVNRAGGGGGATGTGTTTTGGPGFASTFFDNAIAAITYGIGGNGGGGVAAPANTGKGGGGGNPASGGATGGSGIVGVRYLTGTTYARITGSSSNTVPNDEYTTHKFTHIAPAIPNTITVVAPTGSLSTARFNPADKHANGFVSADGLWFTGTDGAADVCARSLTAMTTGRHYIEVQTRTFLGINNTGVGFGNASALLQGWVGSLANTAGLVVNGNVLIANVTQSNYTVLTYQGVDDVVGIALDADTKRFWISRNGAWLNGNPTQNIGGWVATFNGPYYWMMGGRYVLSAGHVGGTRIRTTNLYAVQGFAPLPPPPAVSPVSSTWRLDPAQKAATATLSASNTTLTSTTTAGASARSVNSYASGKIYTECVSPTPGNNITAIGLCNATFPITTGTPGYQNLNSVAFYNFGSFYLENGNGQPLYTAWGAGDIIGVAADLTAKKIWVYQNGVLLTSGDPVTGAGGITFTHTGPYYWVLCGRAIANSIIALPTTYTYAAPAGFTPT